jgi:hypothetical protein
MMDSINKRLLCQFLNEEVNATFFVEDVLTTDGLLKTKAVRFYNCEGKEKCNISYNLRECTCFREMSKIEVEINKIGNHS